MSAARSASPGSWDRATRSSPSSPIPAPAISRSCSTPPSSRSATCHRRPGWKPDSTPAQAGAYASTGATFSVYLLLAGRRGGNVAGVEPADAFRGIDPHAGIAVRAGLADRGDERALGETADNRRIGVLAGAQVDIGDGH